jgi:hypothetical protein
MTSPGLYRLVSMRNDTVQLHVVAGVILAQVFARDARVYDHSGSDYS